MKKIIIFLFYSFFLLIIGRQLEFLPTFKTIEKNETLPPIDLREEVKTITDGFEGDYSVYYEDLVTGEAFGLNHNTVLTAASLNKLPVVFYLYHLASEREIDLGEKIVLQESDIQDYGTGVLRYKEPGGAYTLRQLAELSFQHSDNTAAHLLTVRLGEDNIQSFVNSLNLQATNIAFNETSPQDMGTLLKKFYAKEICNEALTHELMDYLTDTEFEQRIPRFLDTATVYHKVGNADNMVHDAAIVTDGKRPFVLVIMTQGIIDEEKAYENMGSIARLIYEKR